MDKGRIPGRILKNNTGKHIPLERVTVRYTHQVRKNKDPDTMEEGKAFDTE